MKNRTKPDFISVYMFYLTMNNLCKPDISKPAQTHAPSTQLLFWQCNQKQEKLTNLKKLLSGATKF